MVPYGVGVAAADEAYSKEAGLQIVLREGYSASAPDLSVLVTKLKRAKARRDLARGIQP
jgi:branched-chain amino acid transport system substrate-binding protein